MRSAAQTQLKRIVACIASVAAILLLAFTLSIGAPASGFADEQAPSASAPTAQVASEAEGAGASESASESAGESAAAQPAAEAENAGESAAAQQAEEEIIEDEDTPLASALGGNEVQRNAIGGGLHLILILGIVAVAAFFIVMTGKLNRNIDQMKRFRR